MYGLIVKLTAAAGRRNELIRVMGGEDSQAVPGCLSFIVAEDAGDDDVLWITEVWDNKGSHELSLKRPPVAANSTGMDDVIISYERVATTRPVERSSQPLHGRS